MALSVNFQTLLIKNIVSAFIFILALILISLPIIFNGLDASAAITVQNVFTQTEATSDTNFSISGSQSNSDQMIVAIAAYRVGGGVSPTRSLSSVTHQGNLMDFGCLSYDGEYGIELWYLAGANDPTFTIDLTWSINADSKIVNVGVFDGVDSSDPFSSIDCSDSRVGGWNNDPTLAFASATGETVFSGMSMYSGGNTVNPDGDFDSEEWNNTISNVVSSGVIASGASSVNLSWQATQNWPWAVAAISLKPDTSSAGGSPTDIGITYSDGSRNFIVDRTDLSNFEVVGNDTGILVSSTYDAINGGVSQNISGAFFDGTTITTGYQVCREEISGIAHEFWFIENPPVGIGTLSIEYSSFLDSVSTHAVSLADVDYFNGPINDINCLTNSTGGTQISETISTDVNSLVFGGFGINADNPQNLEANPDVTEIHRGDGFDFGFGTIFTHVLGWKYDPGTSPTEITWTMDNSYQWFGGGINIVFNNPPATASVVDTTPPLLDFNVAPSTPYIYTDSTTPLEIDFDGVAEDTESLIKDVKYRINGGSWIFLIQDANSQASESFSTTISGLSEGVYSIEFLAVDAALNESLPSVFDITYDSTGPSISFTEAPTTTGTNMAPITFEGTVSDSVSDVDQAFFRFGTGAYFSLPLIGGTPDSQNFLLELGMQADGIYDLEFQLRDSLGNISYVDYVYTVSNQMAVCELENLTSPTANTIPTYTGWCDDSSGIDLLEYRIYDVVGGDVVSYTPITTLTSGTFGDTYVEFEFTSPISLSDGSYIIEMNAVNGFGNSIFYRPVDFLTIEAVDNKPPQLILNDILPNPTIDTTPFVTGACRDTDKFEINSNINLIEYSVNGGAWVSIPSYDGSYDSDTELFSIELPVLTVGPLHTIEVRCTDSAGNSTEDDSSNGTETITIQAPITEDPSIISFVEEIDTQLRNSIFYTDAIWGNGIIRLRETMSATTQGIDTIGFGDRYSSLTFLSEHRIGEGVGDGFVYTKETEVGVYNPTSGTLQTFDNLKFGVSGFMDAEQVFAPNGDTILIAAALEGLVIFNQTSDSFIIYNHNGFDSALYNPNLIEVDARGGKLGVYIRTDATNVASNSNLGYLDLGTTPLDTTDDNFVWIVQDGTLDTSLTYSIELDESRDILYVSTFGTGIGLVYDAGTPLNTLDDIRSLHSELGSIATDTGVVSGIQYDPTQRALFITNIFNGRENVQVLVDELNTPYDLTDDSVASLASGSNLQGMDPQFMVFVDGPQYVGGQMFIGTDQGRIFYINTNDSYLDTVDDTIIPIDVSGGVFPMSVTGIVMHDYNTLFVNLNRAGLYRVDLTRGWEDFNTAVAVSTPPENKLIVNNISLDALDVVARINEQGIPDPTSSASVDEFISIDDGITWEPIEVGQSKQIMDQDYRVRFRLDLAENPGTTPIIENFGLSFASYQTVPTAASLSVEANPLLVQVNETFDLTVEGLDFLGYPAASYNENVTLTLLDNTTLNPVTYLSINDVTVVNGQVTIPASISQPGEYIVRGDDGTYQDDSSIITVTRTPVVIPDPIPTLDFIADRYTILAGEQVTLSWESEELTELLIDQGIGLVDKNGSIIISLTETTTFVLEGTGSYGDLSSSLTITVIPRTENPVDEEPDVREPSGNSDEPQITQNMQSAPVVTEPKDVIEPIIVSTPFNEKDVTEGDRVTLSWEVTGEPDYVFIPELDRRVGLIGSYDFIATRDSSFEIRAYKDGVLVSSEFVQISVEREDVEVSGSAIETDGGYQGDISSWAPLALAGALISSFLGGLVVFISNISGSGLLNGIGIMIGVLFPRKRKHWGIIFDKKRSEPIKLATIQLLDQDNRVVQQTVTDFDGKYGFILDKDGTYTIYVQANGFNSTRQAISISRNEEVIEDIGLLRLGESLSRRQQFWAIFFDRLRPVLSIILLILMLAGFIITIIAYRNSPILINMLLLVAYALLFLLNAYSFIRRFQFVRGKVINEFDKQGVGGAVVRFYEGVSKVQMAMTNSQGLLKMKLTPKSYLIVVHKDGYSLKRVNKIGVTRRGYLERDIPLTKADDNTQIKHSPFS